MKPWVEDIIKALENLGGQAHRREIFDEIRRIRTEPLPFNLEATVQERIQAYSSDSAHFQNREDYFKKIGNGVWALRDQKERYISKDKQVTSSSTAQHEVLRKKTSTDKNSQSRNSWVVDIVQALTNLGGEAHRKQVIEEVKRIRTEPLPARLEETVQRTIQSNSSDSKGFQGNDLFQKMGNGIWKLRDQEVSFLENSPSPKKTPNVSVHNSPPQSSEEITNILRTIKEYRDYFDPESPNWSEYVGTLFQIFGFSTKNKSNNFIELRLMGSDDKLLAMAFNPGPDEDSVNFWSSQENEVIFSGLAEVLKTKWVIVTNGHFLKLFQFKGKRVVQRFLWQDFDTIVHQEQLDTFYQIYKVFSLIKSDSNQ